MLSNELNALLVCDGVGVGKTISSGYIISYFHLIKNKPSLVICPPVLFDKWELELKKRFGIQARSARTFADFRLMTEELDASSSGQVYLATYPTLLNDLDDHLPQVGVVIFDEIHHLRNPDTKIAQKARNIAQNAEYRVGLSATPVNNSLRDLGSITSTLIPWVPSESATELYESYWKNPVLSCLASFFTKLTKEDITGKLKKRVLRTHKVEYSQSYLRGIEKFLADRRGNNPSENVLGDIVFHRLASSSPAAFEKSSGTVCDVGGKDPKLEAFMSILDQHKHEQLLVFVEFQETANHLASCVKGRQCFVISGEISQEMRIASTNLFQSVEDSVLIMTPVGTEGLDFQFCSTMVNYDLHWNPMKIEQRIGRLDRIGQESDEITIHTLLVKDSIDYRVLDVIRRKLELVEGSFASILPILEEDHDNALPSKWRECDDVEIENAESLENSLRLLQGLEIDDSNIIALLQDGYCDTEAWGAGWEEETPWISKGSSVLESLRRHGNEFSRLLRLFMS